MRAPLNANRWPDDRRTTHTEMRPVRKSANVVIDQLGSEGNLVAMNVGANGTIYIALALHPGDTKFEQLGWAMFFKTQPDSPQRYRIGAWQHGQLIFDVTTDQEMFNVTDIQPLGDEILLVCPRCRRNSESDIEQNGRIYGRDGEFKRSLLFGDGIRDVQVTADQKIWVSYFDEGIFGNYGWNSPLGSSGLVAWAPDGAKLYEFSAPAGVGSMADCYALNVPSNLDAWCYYYDEFPLVHIQNFKIAGVWRVDVAGAHAFAVQDELVLFHGSYNDPEVMHLIELRDAGRTREIGQFRLVDEEANPMKAERVVGRGSHLYIAAGKEVFSVEVGACLEAG